MVGYDGTVTIAALRRALPYLRLYHGRTFVIKAGGEAFAEPDAMRAILEQVGVLHGLGMRCVLVHGGGPQATALAARLGLETHMIEGRRVTDAQTLEATAMVLNGDLNTRLVAVANALGIQAIGLSGVDRGLMRARRRPPKALDSGQVVDYGFVGDIVHVDPVVLQQTLDHGALPIVSPMCADDAGTLLNVNADTAAAALACALGAAKLLLLTATPGILRDVKDEASLVSYSDLAGLAELERQGAMGGGMLPKVAAIRKALDGGVERVHVISHRLAESLLREVFTNEGSGTLIVRDIHELRPEEAALAAAETSAWS